MNLVKINEMQFCHVQRILYRVGDGLLSSYLTRPILSRRQVEVARLYFLFVNRVLFPCQAEAHLSVER